MQARQSSSPGTSIDGPQCLIHAPIAALCALKAMVLNLDALQDLPFSKTASKKLSAKLRS